MCWLSRKIKVVGFRFRNSNKESFECPICSYSGPFKDVNPPTGLRKHAQCPNCGALERHRLQYVVVQAVLSDKNALQMKMLHIAPETFFREFFLKRFGKYETADLNREDVDHRVDLTNLPFPECTFDFVFASHVLEHIPNDHMALLEIRRILKPTGMAVLPVPVVSMKTVEYPEPNPHEAYHVRAPGFDYFDKYKNYFSRVEIYSSSSFSEKYQLFIYEDRTKWPTLECPLRQRMEGEKHASIVPVCYM